ncbi:MAG TPA: hypothetical protein VLZ81_09785 [Blastocatellia bacterium]|nr:hypothetical protein [Blastocatellia bacterium]
MAGICDRCNERTSQLINIAILPELGPVMYMGYRQVCTDCYDDLLAEAKEGGGEPGSGADQAVDVSIDARVEGNTSHLESFAEEVVIEEVTPLGLRFATSRELDTGAVLKIIIPSYGLEFTAITEAVWQDGDQNVVDLNLVEQSEGWDKLWRDYSKDQGPS